MDNSEKASNLGDMRKNYMINIHDQNNNFACCGVLLNSLDFIAPTYCLRNQAYIAYIHTANGCLSRRVNFCNNYNKIEIAKGLLIGNVSSSSKKSPATFVLYFIHIANKASKSRNFPNCVHWHVFYFI